MKVYLLQLAKHRYHCFIFMMRRKKNITVFFSSENLSILYCLKQKGLIINNANKKKPWFTRQGPRIQLPPPHFLRDSHRDVINKPAEHYQAVSIMGGRESQSIIRARHNFPFHSASQRQANFSGAKKLRKRRYKFQYL